ncbi:protein CHLOROPLAST IMPORT APPARATUS 2-like [Zingiber officinale]|uniref:protein CHLOROPLAST IMPORT APPARATUS 2-like n=1 Tax=Zingiber officinale TaxID=94328 RepID=UPI001C4AA1B2|nr:protein CHLOROPLAST IMPORT APPARATUS 2-like [Zingiber officinale]
MTSCLCSGTGGGGRSCGFDIVKSTSSSWSHSLESSSSSSPSSALSESSNSPTLAISIKRERTPRKRPNQTYNEATAILSATYPVVFSAGKTARPSVSIPTNPFHPFSEPPDLLPPLPILNDAAFLIPNPNPPSPAAATHFHLKSKTYATVSKDSAESPASEVSWEPKSPAHPIEEDFDPESILEAENPQQFRARLRIRMGAEEEGRRRVVELEGGAGVGYNTKLQASFVSGNGGVAEKEQEEGGEEGNRCNGLRTGEVEIRSICSAGAQAEP